MIGVGVLVGFAVIAFDEVGRMTGRGKCPPLAVGLGIYLPASTTAPVVLGAVAVGRTSAGPTNSRARIK